MTSSHHAPYVLVYTRATMVGNRGQSKPQKPDPSSDCRLQPACMKSESLVIAGQHTAVNKQPPFKECVIAHWSRDPAPKIPGAKVRNRSCGCIRKVYGGRGAFP